jgi:transcriptional regulator with XRE-family HTH domain
MIKKFETVKKTIGDRIRSIRASKGYSQANVAEELGITHGAYAKIERGETDPSAGRLAQIAKVLEVRVTDFFEDQSTHHLAAEEIKNYGFASKDEVESLAKLVQSLVKEFEKLRHEVASTPTYKVKKRK